MRSIATALLVLLQTATYPPPYPREGTRLLIDNERVQVWDVTWPKGAHPPMHRHLYDMTGVYYWPGDRIITAPDGSKRTVSTPAGRIQWQLKGVTHIEEGTSDDSLRAVMIELKGDGAPATKAGAAADAPAFSVPSMPLLDNERVTVWDYTGPQPNAPRHHHPTDTVVVFTKDHEARAIFVPAGTVHEAEAVPAGTKATMFELKPATRVLFDGSSLDGWRGYKAESVPAGWRIVDGTLAKDRPVADILSKDEFGDFDLELEWRIGEAGNSGIFYRGTEEYDHIYWSAPEYQLLDDVKGADNTSRLTSAGAAYAVYPSPAGHLKPVGDWNVARIVAAGNHVEHWLNGVKLLEYEIGSPDWETRVKASKFAAWPNYGRAKRGHIALQGDHAGTLAFRNIRVKALR